MRVAAPIVWLMAGAAVWAADASTAPALTADNVVSRMMAADRARTPLLERYTSVRHYVLENKRFGTKAAMTVQMTYRWPGVKEFKVLEQSGPSPVRSKVFRRMIDSELDAMKDGGRSTKISPDNYNFQLLNQESLNGRRCYVLDAVPKTKNQYLFRGRIFVDAEDWAVARIEGTPAQSPSFWVRKTAFVHTYHKYGPFWLAESNQSDTDVLVFGHTQVRIEYSDYHINALELML